MAGMLTAPEDMAEAPEQGQGSKSSQTSLWSGQSQGEPVQHREQEESWWPGRLQAAGSEPHQPLGRLWLGTNEYTLACSSSI